MVSPHGTVRCYFYGPGPIDSGDTRNGCRCVPCTNAYQAFRAAEVSK